jgi:alpha-ketoglutarate-dependent taurine dioxygenase
MTSNASVVPRFDGASAPAVLAERARRAIAGGTRCCIVERLPVEADHGPLLALCSALGQVAIDSVVEVDGVQTTVYVQRVEVDDARVRTRDGFVRHSASNREFPCHTDCASDAEVPDVLLLQCAFADDAGGESIVLTARALVDALGDAARPLYEPVYPFAFGRAPIVAGEGDGLSVRYNRHEIEKAAALVGTELPPAMTRTLDRVDATIRDHPQRLVVPLKAGDCLVVDNHAALHGRTSFAHASDRLLFRVRAFSH